MLSGRKVAWRLAQLGAIALILFFVWYALRKDLPGIAITLRTIRVRPLPLIASCSIVFVSYAVLIETWRQVVGAWGGTLTFGEAARIWFISNLGKWLPGKIWQITAMGAMSQRAGVSAIAAVGSSILIAVINVLAGVALVFLTAGNALNIAPAVLAVLGGIAIVVTLVPNVVPAAARRLAKLFKRDISWPPIRQRSIVIAYVGCAIAWVLYGVAFQLFCASVVPGLTGAPSDYVAVFTASYIAGYLFLPAPGGVGVREAVLVALLARYGAATTATAAVIAVLSRVWLTALELLPGLLLLARSPKPQNPTPR